MLDELNSTVQLVIVLVAIIAAAIWLRSTLAAKRSMELESLVEIRGKRITDLETHVLQLETRITQLEGQVEILQGKLVVSIVDGVGNKVEDVLKDLLLES